MDRGLYTAASGMIAGLLRQEAIVQNLSNMRTVGYKADQTTTKDFPSLLLSQVRGGKASTKIGNLGTGVSLASLTTNFEDGPLKLTDHPYDFSIAGEGFFRVQTPNGVRYTRDGRFHTDADGQLISSDGYPVLGPDGPITLPQGPIAVTAAGVIFVDDEAVGQFSLAKFNDLTTLEKEGQTLFNDPNSDAEIMAPEDVQLHQGYLEDSNVDVTQMITEMTTVLRAYELSQHMVQIQDRVNGQTVSELGRV